MLKPDKQTLQEIEDFLLEILEEKGVDIKSTPPEILSKKMNCLVYPNGSMLYEWESEPILEVTPEQIEENLEWVLRTP